MLVSERLSRCSRTRESIASVLQDIQTKVVNTKNRADEMLDLVEENLSKRITDIEERLTTCLASIKSINTLIAAFEQRVKYLEDTAVSYHPVLYISRT